MSRYFFFFVLVVLSSCSSIPNVSFRDIQPVEIKDGDNLIAVDDFTVKGIKHYRALIESDFTKDSFADVLIAPLQFNLPEEKEKKISDKDRKKLQEAFDRARKKAFKGFKLADKVGPDTLAIHTWLTDEVPSNVVLNYALWIIVPAMDVGAAAIESQGFVGDRLIGTAVGARDGTIAVSGYTKWGVIEQGFELWLTGLRNWLEMTEGKASEITPAANVSG